jgi:hypothetical protein
MTAKQPFDIGPAPDFQRGDRVRVYEEGIEPWLATVQTLKPSHVSGWWTDVERDGDGTWTICLALTRVEVVARKEES